MTIATGSPMKRTLSVASRVNSGVGPAPPIRAISGSGPGTVIASSSARVLSVDVSAARALPGVVAALTGAELEAMTVPGPDPLMALIGGAGPTPEFTLLATDKVRFMGDPVAIVIAESRYVAEDGCELVDAEYDDLPPVTN